MAYFAVPALFRGSIGKSLDELVMKGWSSEKAGHFKGSLIYGLSLALAPSFQETFIQRWFDFLDQNMSASRLLQYALYSNLLISDRVSYRRIVTPSPYEVRFAVWWKEERFRESLRKCDLQRSIYKTEVSESN